MLWNNIYIYKYVHTIIPTNGQMVTFRENSETRMTSEGRKPLMQAGYSVSLDKVHWRSYRLKN